MYFEEHHENKPHEKIYIYNSNKTIPRKNDKNIFRKSFRKYFQEKIEIFFLQNNNK